MEYNNKIRQVLLSLTTSVLHSATLYTMVIHNGTVHKILITNQVSMQHASSEFLHSMRSENDKKPNVSIQTPA